METPLEQFGIRRFEASRPGRLDWRLYYRGNGSRISPIHDLPWQVDPQSPPDEQLIHMVVEIPRGTQAKLEMVTKEKWNPIKQDAKNDELRYVAFPYPFNYGAIPQTFENPKHIDSDTGFKGDGDPIDAVEIGTRTHRVGDVIRAKIIGIWGMFDDGETDWKVLVIDARDPKAELINTIDDAEREFPGVIAYAYNFLVNYKVPDGKPQNQFAFNGRLQPASKAFEVIQETHVQWQAAINSKTQDDIWTKNWSLQAESRIPSGDDGCHIM